ncbi:hypothetical protein M23134_05222 [Microscilla marina ATCC 23134]|uniref:Uncharacterized protein n=1 Tax=Microscilla marina ATCC 23134 TaxID=313606 RepID=A1ZDH8_MICM2|nr:hypothetical protein M23134_05222 [Microscilla marina ATCC 23134]
MDCTLIAFLYRGIKINAMLGGVLFVLRRSMSFTFFTKSVCQKGVFSLDNVAR